MRRSTPIEASAKLTKINALKGAIPKDGGRQVEKHSNSVKKSESPMKRRTSRVEERRDSSEVMAELVSQLRQQLEVKSVPTGESAGDEHDAVRPNLDRLTVGVDLGDQWSNYFILGLGGETLREGQFRTRRQEVGEFFQGLAVSRVVIEVGTHSAWVRSDLAFRRAQMRLQVGRSVLYFLVTGKATWEFQPLDLIDGLRSITTISFRLFDPR